MAQEKPHKDSSQVSGPLVSSHLVVTKARLWVGFARSFFPKVRTHSEVRKQPIFPAPFSKTTKLDRVGGLGPRKKAATVGRAPRHPFVYTNTLFLDCSFSLAAVRGGSEEERDARIRFCRDKRPCKRKNSREKSGKICTSFRPVLYAYLDCVV